MRMLALKALFLRPQSANVTRLYNAYLPYLQTIRGAEFGDSSTYIVYRNQCIIASLGVPGALLGGAMVEIRKFGRRGTLSLSTILTGVFLYCSTTATSSNALLGWNCAYNFTSNIMYAVLYAYTPEVFPTKVSPKASRVPLGVRYRN